nr:DUF4433 domain-containing protein [uncultured Desulfobacter sp.]
MSSAPGQPKICHILHHDKLPFVINDGFLLSDAIITARIQNGTTIGMSGIKQRRLYELTLTSHPYLYVGQCVPFYFCPRSIMLYLMYMKNLELAYKGGQEPIVHLVADLGQTIKWANDNNKRWAFTTSNAGSYYFEDYCNLSDLRLINWDAVHTNQWAACKEEKQAEFLIEECFPWELVEQIGVISPQYVREVSKALVNTHHKPPIAVRRNWYYP